jgi:glycosyltransferase involved in cell wall biosynthesis
MTTERPLRVAMLASTRERCGIAAYSRALADALAGRVDLDLVPLDPQPLTPDAVDRLNAAQLIHIQHEYSFWGSALPGRSRFDEVLRVLRRPWVLTAHTVAPAEEVLNLAPADGRWRAAMKRLGVRLPGVRRFVEQAPFWDAAALVTHSAAAREMLIARGFAGATVRFLPMPCPRPAEPEDPEGARRALGLLGVPYLLGFGFITPAKGYEHALAAFARLEYPGLLVLAGAARDADGEAYLRELQARVQELGIAGRVRFPGYLEDAALTDVLRGADLALLPYLRGTGSYALSLALACGVPVLTSDLPGFAGMPAVRVPPTPEAILAGMRDYLAHPERRHDLAVAAREWAARHSWAAAGVEHVRLYRDVLG